MNEESGQLIIDSVPVPGGGDGLIGMCACPGGRRYHTGIYDPGLHLEPDIRTIGAWGASGLVSLIEEEEVAIMGLRELPQLVETYRMWWLHLPIRDMRTPTTVFEKTWTEESPRLRQLLRSGERIVIHCWAGLGRTGTITARLLVEMGMEPAAAILRVRDARPGTIQNRAQERYVLKQRPLRGEA